jgi:hypothetical protein
MLLGLYLQYQITDSSVRESPTLSKRRLNCSFISMRIVESLFNLGSEERISNDKGSIFYTYSPVKVSRFLHFAIEGSNILQSSTSNVVELASINAPVNLGKSFSFRVNLNSLR